MSNNPGGISQSASYSSGVNQQAGIGRQIQQTTGNQMTAHDDNEQLTKEEVIALLVELKELINTAELPEKAKGKALYYIAAATNETEWEEPKKDIVASNLSAAIEIIDNKGDLVKVDKGLWEKVKLNFNKIAGWLGEAAISLLEYLS